MHGRVAVAAALAGTTIALAAGSASAVEREHAVGIDAGGTVLVVNDKSSPDVGGGAGIHYTYGINDAFNFVASAGWSLVALNEKLWDPPTTPHTRPTNLTMGNLGLAYVLDVLRWVPWGAVELGGYGLQGGTLDKLKILPGFAIAVGLDYRLNRSWSLGVEARQHMLFTEMSTYPSITQLFARFEYVWGW